MSGADARCAFVNARLIDPASGYDGPGGVITEGGRIVAAGADVRSEGVTQDAERIDCGGLCLCPGLVDMRVHLREPGEEHKETFATASQAAAAGGVTTMACLPNTDPVIDEVALVDFVQRRARDTAIVRIVPYAALTRRLEGTDLSEMGMLAQAGAVGFTDGDVAIADSAVMLRALKYANNFGLLVIQHAEDPALARSGSMNAGALATRLGLAGVPAAAEAIMLERDVRLLALVGGRYHAAHLSSGDGIEVVRAAKARGLDISAETAPHYFTLNETAIGDYRTFAKVSPPLRSERDRRAVIAGIRDGTIEVIASDHSPQDQDSKRVPFAQAADGIVGLETLLALTLALYHAGEISLLQAIRTLTYAPARRLGLECGRLAPGAPADLLLFDLDEAWRIDVGAFRSKSKNAPFDDHEVRGRVRRTVVAGRTVFARVA